MQQQDGAQTLPSVRSEFPVLRSITTRWMDNDHYGHVNNVVYYSYFDTAVNGYLIEASGTDIRELPVPARTVFSGNRARGACAGASRQFERRVPDRPVS